MGAARIRARALTCPTCGATLRWDGELRVVECRHCHAHVVVDTGRTTDAATDGISKPTTRSWPVVLAVGAAVLVIAVTSVVLIHRTPPRVAPTATPPVRRATAAELAATPLASTPQEVAARFGVTVSGATVEVPLADDRFASARFHWRDGHLDHVGEISLRALPEADLTEVVTAARAQLGRRLRPTSDYHAFSARNVSFTIGAQVTLLASQLDAPGWQERFAAVWTVMRGVALGTGDAIDDRVRRDVLNLAYPVTVLAEIGFTTDVDGAAAEVHRVAAAAEHDGADHVIGLGHPWFERAILRWDNRPAGRWTGITLYFPDELDFARTADAMAACLTPVLGEPERLVRDHLAGTFALQYAARGGRPWVDLSDRVLSIYPHYSFGDPATASGLRELVTALAGCGG